MCFSKRISVINCDLVSVFCFLFFVFAIKIFVWKTAIDEHLIALLESYLQSNAIKPNFILLGMASVIESSIGSS